MTDLEKANELAADWKGHYSVTLRDRIHASLKAARNEGKADNLTMWINAINKAFPGYYGVVSNEKDAVRFLKAVTQSSYSRGADDTKELAAKTIETQVVSRKHGEWLWKVYFPRIIRALKIER